VPVSVPECAAAASVRPHAARARASYIEPVWQMQTVPEKLPQCIGAAPQQPVHCLLVGRKCFHVAALLLSTYGKEPRMIQAKVWTQDCGFPPPNVRVVHEFLREVS
jgi:hypothetical protein